ncbi:MAG: DUF4845 domain-containing protein [Gammaproteobacteria bacterium]|nr:MAG: DUF4845 domain-containing protein [Gammaproteobacteria bacterium]
MHSLNRQKGMTAIGWLIVLALIGFFVLLALRMVPAYMEYYKVVSTLESLEEETGWSNVTPQAIRRLIERRFDISYVQSITPRQVSIKPLGAYYNVSARYEAREPIFGNVYVVMKFHKQVKVRRN